MLRVLSGTVAGLALLSATSAAVAQVSAAAKAFGARESVVDASMSPDGKAVALVQALANPQATAVFIAPLDGSTAPKPIMSSTGKPDRVTDCGWVSNTRLACNIYMLLTRDARKLGFTRLAALNADGSKVVELSTRNRNFSWSYQQFGGGVVDWLADDASGAVLMTRDYSEEGSTGTLLGNQREGLAVERVDTQTLARTPVEPPRGDATVYISDQHGTVRIVGQRLKTNTGYSTERVNYLYRPAGGGGWTALSSYDDDAHTGFMPVAVDRDLNAAYGFEWIDGRQAVVRVSLDGTAKREVMLARDDVDVDRLIRIGRDRRVVGVSFATDKRQAVFFDPALKGLAAALSKALPGQPAVHFVDASQDGSRLLLWAGSDVDPGHYYLFDRTSKKLAEVMPDRPELAGYKLSPVQPIRYKAADGTMVPGYLTLPPGSDGKNLPAIVLPHGGPGARDEWGFDWLAQFFAHQGYAVLQPNYRGSSGYGEAWFQKNGFQSWKTAIGDVNDAGRWLQSQGIAAPGKLAIVGWSYGGYAALQSSVLDPDLFKAIVAVAPVTDLDSLREESRAFTSFKVVDNFIGRGPHVKEGSPAQNAGKIKAPVLLFHGDEDSNVRIGESRLMQSRLKAAGGKVELVEFPGLDHQLDDSAARATLLDRADRFLKAALNP